MDSIDCSLIVGGVIVMYQRIVSYFFRIDGYVPSTRGRRPKFSVLSYLSAKSLCDCSLNTRLPSKSALQIKAQECRSQTHRILRRLTSQKGLLSCLLLFTPKTTYL